MTKTKAETAIKAARHVARTPSEIAAMETAELFFATDDYIEAISWAMTAVAMARESYNA
jgi:ElaB/YqjD/DUF883 family membrane-anchored ribosome-binding protein